jgi:hypothetical protein
VPAGCSITEAVTILGNKLGDYQSQFNTTRLLALCDYFHNTFIRHYKLYQYVLGQDQEVNLTVTHVEVRAPPQPLPLAEGTDGDLWRHKQQVAELSSAEVQKRVNLLLLKETLRLEQEVRPRPPPRAPLPPRRSRAGLRAGLRTGRPTLLSAQGSRVSHVLSRNIHASGNSLSPI